MVVPFEPFGRSKPTTVRRLPGLLQDGERLLAFAQAHHARAMRSRVLALTDRRLIMLARSKDEAVEISLERVTSAKLVRLRLVDSKLTVQTDAGPLKFTNIFPAHQGERMATLLGNADRAEERFALLGDLPIDPLDPPLAVVEEAGKPVRAYADTAGNIPVTGVETSLPRA